MLVSVKIEPQREVYIAILQKCLVFNHVILGPLYEEHQIFGCALQSILLLAHTFYGGIFDACRLFSKAAFTLAQCPDRLVEPLVIQVKVEGSGKAFLLLPIFAAGN